MSQVRTSRGRRRDPDLDQRILGAALAEYGRCGWAGFTMDGVARRAQVGKSGIYLRWPTKEDLLIEALEAHSTPMVARDTGSLRGDVTALATGLLTYWLDPTGWAAIRITVDAVVEAVDLGEFYRRIVTMHNEAATRMVRRAIDRGELGSDAPVQAVIQSLYGGVFMLVLSFAPAERAHAHTHAGEHVAPLIDFVLAGAALAAPAPSGR